jgi:hypothetical protein
MPSPAPLAAGNRDARPLIQLQRIEGVAVLRNNEPRRIDRERLQIRVGRNVVRCSQVKSSPGWAMNPAGQRMKAIGRPQASRISGMPSPSKSPISFSCKKSSPLLSKSRIEAMIMYKHSES